MRKYVAPLVVVALLCLPLSASAGAISLGPAPDSEPTYVRLEGTVQEVRGLADNLNPNPAIAMDLADEKRVVLVIKPGTFFLDGVDPLQLKAGDSLVAFYDARVPTVRIFPPQYAAVALLPKQEGIGQVKLDVYDENLLSADGQLLLHIGEQTQVVNLDGTPYEGEVKNVLAVAYYSIVAYSMPPQTTPEKLVVLPVAAPEAAAPATTPAQ
ncbi:MAG: hypothetical protein LBU67_06780 [Oscillospiraceae bacterium]|nr:hypothetical protein [Oscillospiraceae bacterium]